MEFKDKRSFKVLIVPDYIINSFRYNQYPPADKVAEEIMSRGYGVIKMPPLHFSEESIKPWIISVADQVQEYMNRGFKIAVLSISFLPEGGVWFNELEKELKQRGIPLSNSVALDEEDITKGGAVEKIGSL